MNEFYREVLSKTGELARSGADDTRGAARLLLRRREASCRSGLALSLSHVGWRVLPSAI